MYSSICGRSVKDFLRLQFSSNHTKYFNLRYITNVSVSDNEGNKEAPERQRANDDTNGRQRYPKMDPAERNRQWINKTRDKLRYLHNLPENTPRLRMEDDKLTKHQQESTEIIDPDPSDIYFLDERVDDNTIEPLTNEKIHERFKPYLQKNIDLSEKEKFFSAPFGMIRFDSEQNESIDVEQDLNHSISDNIGHENKPNFFDEQYFPESKPAAHGDEMKPFKSHRSEKPQRVTEQQIHSEATQPETNIFDEHYFADVTSQTDKINSELAPDSDSSTPNWLDEQISPRREPDMPQALDNKTTATPQPRYQKKMNTDEDQTQNVESNIFDDQYFSTKPAEQSTAHHQIHPSVFDETIGPNQPRRVEVKSNVFDDQYFGDMLSKETSKPDKKEMITQSQQPAHGEIPESPKEIHSRSQSRREKLYESGVKPDLTDPKTPLDMALKIRKEKKAEKQQQHSDTTEDISRKVPNRAKWEGKVDSKGFRILTTQTLDLDNMTRDSVVNILKHSIIYEDEELVAIDKPYGLSSHGGPGIHHSIGQLLEQLAQKLHRDKLYLIHRLDKETTGVMLLAKTQQSQHVLHNMFVKQQMTKKYWLLTRGVPDPVQGIIDIPMGEGLVGKKVRMALRPRYTAEQKELLQTKNSKPSQSQEAVTHYRVLDSNHQVALVECRPETGKKHQIRCHMAFALNTPILGDHKYSHFSKFAPQKLHPEILQHLGIRQAKVRHLAMHLHARQMIVPEYKDGRNLFITANLPAHFRQNIKWLKINYPKN